MTVILLTGATGFVGNEILKSFVDDNNVSFVLVLRPGQIRTIQSKVIIKKIYESVDALNENADWWEKVCDGVDIIIHCAWYAKHGKYLSSVKNINCLYGSLQLVEGAIKASVKKIIGIGTCLEKNISFLGEKVKLPADPQSLYAATKLSFFLCARELLSKANISFAWCRLFYIYGENENSERLYGYILKSIKDKKNIYLRNPYDIKDYMHVSDVASRIKKLAISNQHGEFDICSGKPQTLQQFTLKILQENGLEKLLKEAKN